MVSLVVVAAFLLLIVASATGLVASQWQRELAVPNAPPTMLGPRAGEDAGTLAGPESKAQPPVDLSDIDPLAPRYAEWAERAAKLQTADTVKVDTLPLGADRLGRDVLAKAIKGTEISVFVGVLAALLATVIGTVLGALGGFFGGKIGDFLEWVYNVFTAVPDILLIFAFAAVLGRGVAFEVDGYDAELGEAWSVVVKGWAHELERVEELLHAEDLPLFPWNASPKGRWVRIEPEDVTGRRFRVVETIKVEILPQP
jgi:ABC-type dipeptide/oligopeptide/nickel transport system permease subunit